MLACSAVLVFSFQEKCKTHKSDSAINFFIMLILGFRFSLGPGFSQKNTVVDALASSIPGHSIYHYAPPMVFENSCQVRVGKTLSLPGVTQLWLLGISAFGPKGAPAGRLTRESPTTIRKHQP
jgi:hypothetical protein